MRRLLEQNNTLGSSSDITVLGCSNGAEVYSILSTIHSALPDLKLNMHAVDISREILQTAERGVYSLTEEDRKVIWTTFARMTDEELEALFELVGEQARIKSWVKEGIIWLQGDAGDPAFIDSLDPQDIVVANRFLCHMKPGAAEKCLLNIARLVKPGGYLFVSGIDLDVRTKVAREKGWKPVTDLMKAIHEGDPSLTMGWPLKYWGVEPFCTDQPDWKIRYASVFQIGEIGALPNRVGEHAITTFREALNYFSKPFVQNH